MPTKTGRSAYIRENGDGPWGECDWEPPIKSGEAYAAYRKEVRALLPWPRP